MTEAILLVGGKGTRLRPLTVNTPKPMLPVAGVPFLTHQLVRAKDAGVHRVVFATAYKAEVFEEYFGDGSDLGLELVYVTEEVPLDTAGAIRNVADRLTSAPDEPVLVFNGDILSGVDIGALVAAHRERGADVTLHLSRVTDPRPFGLVPTDAEGWVTAFLEKPQRPEDIVTDQINAGCYVFQRARIDEIPAGRRVSVERETFPGLLTAGAKVLGVVEQSYWLDLGTPTAFAKGSADLVMGIVTSSAVPGPEQRGSDESLVLPGARIAEDAVADRGTTVGSGAVIDSGAHVSASVLDAGAVIGPGAKVNCSIIGAGARIGANTVLDGVVVGDGAVIGADNELRAGARVWCGAVLPDKAVRFSSDE
ncbi:NDP-sugar synthase [Catenulispora sp. NF23]|uniref:NDP-sugar synthase n=1 Tax=Catenulispora pinistramenti TaxID=2705254 RepID=A0ABS5KLI7_9ACTN|nr:NDP-sugar synthase [Catenulispora pinistramenti]MBS2539453.1 NDP-sugar synthase [Catenulispora pinistramenti]MBS2546880.1 NDP-sugar synthase [Catenulispora pinistramenti]